ncbi:hypothetical protein SAMN06297387_10224 [Streptomyces zhaozhouensis]|uniref:Putative T7SS secretion signal domain-containing protein n=1 Tax=Streptomyces zhaozhouensis TaxID=1300267 RepID=A0A286DNC3_9ACTN|nr:hypothetical protein [Streptomyces zhaozhouensis]SOD60131.1 hypothetical protein SAMN06297387_10224 [Streptomyces zhaozhouensis]
MLRGFNLGGIVARPSDWSPVDMDRDPTPGDPDEVRELADELEEFADDVGEALGKIRGMAGERAMLEWAGLSADAFRREFDGVPDNLTKLEDSYSLCGQALHTYWPKLQTAQREFDQLGPNGGITPRGENFVTQHRGYVDRLRNKYLSLTGRKGNMYTNLVEYQMQPGTLDALIQAGRGSGDNLATISRYPVEFR